MQGDLTVNIYKYHSPYQDIKREKNQSIDSGKNIWQIQNLFMILLKKASWS